MEPHVIIGQPYTRQELVLLDAWCGVPIVQHKRTLSTFINSIVRAGLQLEQLIEGECPEAVATDEQSDPARWYSVPRAQLMPTTFIIKARKPLVPPQ
jgi:hypothetical protein